MDPACNLHTQRCNCLSEKLRESRLLAACGRQREFHTTSESSVLEVMELDCVELFGDIGEALLTNDANSGVLLSLQAQKSSKRF